MARPFAGRGLRADRLVVLQLPLGGEAVDEDLIHPQVRAERELAGRINGDRVGVRPFLALRVDARSVMLVDITGGVESPGLIDRQDGDTAARVIRHQDVAAGRVDGEVAGIGAVRRLAIDEGQVAGFWIAREGADPAPRMPVGFQRFIDRVDEAAIGVESDERGIGDICDRVSVGQCARLRID